jgi:SP family general alpha glucoside:H+ symporter-like MFS transporter
VIPYFGRRQLYLAGLFGITISLVVIGATGCVPATDALRNTSAAFMIFISFVYNISIGPLCESGGRPGD